MVNDKRGITLVALVITVVIMLILIGTAISQIRGEEGILERTNYVVSEYKDVIRNEEEFINSLPINEAIHVHDDSCYITQLCSFEYLDGWSSDGYWVWRFRCSRCGYTTGYIWGGTHPSDRTCDVKLLVCGY